MATGMAVGGFGGGAMVGAPLAQKLIGFFQTPTSVGLWQAFARYGMLLYRYDALGQLHHARFRSWIQTSRLCSCQQGQHG